MPAHLSAGRIGEDKCGDGRRVTRAIWEANKLVDELAKRGAAAARASPALLWSVAARQVEAEELAVFVGQVNALANAWTDR